MLRITNHFLERYAERRGLDKREARRQIEREFGKTRQIPRRKAERLIRGHLDRVGHYRTDGVGVWVIENAVGMQKAVTYLVPRWGATVATTALYEWIRQYG